MYATRPRTVGRLGCVDGKSTRAIEGERISEGSGDWRSVGMRDWRISIAVFPGRADVSQLISSGEEN